MSLEERKDQAIVLAALMIEEAERIQTKQGKRQRVTQLARMMQDPIGKVFTTAVTDQCFRNQRPPRVAHQLVFLIKKYSIPRYLSLERRLALQLFAGVGKPLAYFSVPLTVHMIRKETETVILPGEEGFG